MSYENMKNTLAMIESPVEKLDMLMEFGKGLEPIPENSQCTEIFGCTSFVQICEKNNRFYACADSAIVRGIVALLLAMLDGKSKQEIKNITLAEEFSSLNLNLGAARLNGVNSMIRFFKNL